MNASPYTRAAALPQLLRERIVVLDGAMGTMIQRYRLGESDFRGERFRDHPKSLKGNGDVLQLTRPDVVEAIHEAYLRAGADIVETNTFGATRIAQADYGLEGAVREMNVEGARLARAACDTFASADKPRFVAGALGPTPRTASISPDVNDPAARNVTFAELRDAYREQAEGLLEGGCDLFLVETIFDTLNAKAAIFALDELMEASGERLPVIVSGTVTDASGRILSGQTVGAFWHSVRHARPLAIGLNCALGAALMRPYVEELARIAGDTFVSCYPNAGLPNPMSETGFDETPEITAGLLEEFAKSGFLNIAGGCCGTTPEHIALIAERVGSLRTARAALARARGRGMSPSPMKLSGLEPVTIGEGSLFVNIGERTNVTGSKAFARMILDGQFEEALARRAPAGRERRPDHRRQHGRGDARLEGGDGALPQPRRRRARDRARADHDRQLEVGGDRGRPAVHPGQGDRQLDLDEGRRGGLSPPREARSPLRRRRGRDGVRRAGPGRQLRAQDRDLRARLPHPGRRRRLPARGHHLRPQHLRDRDRHRGARQLRGRLHRGDALDQAEPAGREGLGRRQQRELRFRGNDPVREAIHTVFLYHAIKAGMDMGIVNAGMVGVYDDLDPELRERVEDVVLNRRKDAGERLVEIAERAKGAARDDSARLAWRGTPSSRRRSTRSSRMRSSTASPTSSSRTPRRRGSRSRRGAAGRCT